MIEVISSGQNTKEIYRNRFLETQEYKLVSLHHWCELKGEAVEDVLFFEKQDKNLVIDVDPKFEDALDLKIPMEDSPEFKIVWDMARYLILHIVEFQKRNPEREVKILIWELGLTLVPTSPTKRELHRRIVGLNSLFIDICDRYGIGFLGVGPLPIYKRT